MSRPVTADTGNGVNFLNPTLNGLLAVVVWGAALPMARYIGERIGVLAFMGVDFTIISLIGFAVSAIRRGRIPREAFRHPALYARWTLMVLNVVLIFSAMVIVAKPHVPLVILLNYLWPTAIILFSIAFAGVTVTRRSIFVGGTLLVLCALMVEILTPDIIGLGLFARPLDDVAYAMAICAALSWGGYSALTRRFGTATGGSAVAPIFQATLALNIIPSFLPGLATWGNLTPSLAVILFLWCCLHCLAFFVWDRGMRLGNVVVLSLCADFIPWLSLSLSHLMLGVAIGGKTVLSALLLVMGAIIARYGTVPLRIREDIPPGD